MTMPPEPAAFTVYPAIDLRAGQVVRLAQGDPGRQTVYGSDPRAVAERWLAEGAAWLHVVNLDGAFGDDSAPNHAALRAILATGARVQFGGGLRAAAGLRRVFDLGVARAVLGTAAVEDPALVDQALADFGPERVAVGIDARDGQVRVRGWAEGAGLTAVDLGRRLRGQGVTTCIFTDVARDGVGAGVNVAATTELAAATGLRVIASGGLAGVDDVHRVRRAGLAGLIAGRALYEGQLRLAHALWTASLDWPVTLTGHGVCLRPPRADELAYVRWLWSDPASMAPVGGVHALTDEQAARWFEHMVAPGRPTDFYCLIFDAGTGEPVGEVSCHRLDWETMTAMFNVKVAAARRGRGYGRAALRVFLDWYFNRLGGRVMVDDLAPDNTVGQQAVLNFGFTPQGNAAADGFFVALTRERFNQLYPQGGA
mgnify:CR=1 FL=1